MGVLVSLNQSEPSLLLLTGMEEGVQSRVKEHIVTQAFAVRYGNWPVKLHMRQTHLSNIEFSCLGLVVIQH